VPPTKLSTASPTRRLEAPLIAGRTTVEPWQVCAHTGYWGIAISSFSAAQRSTHLAAFCVQGLFRPAELTRYQTDKGAGSLVP